MIQIIVLAIAIYMYMYIPFCKEVQSQQKGTLGGGQGSRQRSAYGRRLWEEGR